MGIKKHFLKYHEARAVVKNYQLPVETSLDYELSYKYIHTDLPSDPPTTYKNDWIDWKEFLK
ncbi:hypothetical protein HN615_15930 [Candidatus Woesearchaeota archaeon]|jgi:hypothetical protein|nr:hypothetical protein [Candidatus Woesearchaeota archaeon]